MVRLLKTSLLIYGLLITSYSFSQDSTVVRDFELWTGVSVKKSFLDKKLDFTLTEEFRFEDNSTSINNYFTELGGKYELINGLSVGAAYRFSRYNRSSGYVNINRFNTDLSYKHKIDRLSLDYRFRYQRQSPLTQGVGEDVISKLRFRLKMEYNIKSWKLDPYFSAEGFYAMTINNINYIESITESERVSGFQKLRFTLGTEYKINKLMRVGAFYRIEREMKSYPLNYNTPATFYIAGINLTFKL